ncbi:MAG: hypothetical protein H8E49_04165 [Gammaproteobacteria bacterium]|nr:hypothetical protein [Gammaproteobacteria bacterium]
MWLRMRQIAGVAAELKPVEEDLIDILGIEVCYRDPGIDFFGLENALFPIGNQLLEVVAPIQENTAGGRYLDRRGGDSGYMVITQCDDHPPRRQRVEELGVRIVHDNTSNQFINMQLHPRDTGGTFFEIDQQLGENALEKDGPWHPAGPDWQAGQRLDRVTGIKAAEIQCDDPEMVARKWAEIAETDLDLSDGTFVLAMENADVRFVPCTDTRPEGLGGIDLEVVDRDAILAAAEKRGKISGENQVYLCGMRMNV